ncbi:MAG TPA: GIY-YIG nuclease family protein, partial [Chryseolinea sp.]|nr:GIY-YIG nuclease family protein [Chryseolinea sp.]
GLICLKQKYKQTNSKFENFALMLERQMPFGKAQIMEHLQELCNEDVIQVTEDTIYQKRMVKDGELSIIRTEIGKKGGNLVTKQYGKPGYLYFMSDTFGKHKIGISKNPQNRLYRLRSDLNLDKAFSIISHVYVADMGTSEDIAHAHFAGQLDGEWLIGDYNDLFKKFDLLIPKVKAKPEAKGQANTEYEIETEIEGDNEFKYELSKAEKKVKTIEAKIDIVYPFVTERFINAWSLWLDHRKGLKKPYRSALSQQTALKKLSEYDEDTAIKMINQSIENDWQGLFELKDQKNGTSKKGDATNARREAFARKHGGGA